MADIWQVTETIRFICKANNLLISLRFTELSPVNLAGPQGIESDCGGKILLMIRSEVLDFEKHSCPVCRMMPGESSNVVC